MRGEGERGRAERAERKKERRPWITNKHKIKAVIATTIQTCVFFTISAKFHVISNKTESTGPYCIRHHIVASSVQSLVFSSA